MPALKLNNLTPSTGSLGREKRIGRGEGSGHGGTSTRGMNGAQSRSGYSRKAGFEGGQMPLQRRLPKFEQSSLCHTISLQFLNHNLNFREF